MKKLLLHSCCGPCSTAVIERLLNEFEFDEIGVFYYNPNIHPKEEYEHRKQEQIRYISELNNNIVRFIDADYNPEKFFECTKGLENEKEGGERCNKCFELRLLETAKFAKEKGYVVFGTTLTVSPHKNAAIINQIGKEIENKFNIEFLEADFKKKEGFKRSLVLAKEYNLYRQNYCGCVYSLNASKN